MLRLSRLLAVLAVVASAVAVAIAGRALWRGQSDDAVYTVKIRGPADSTRVVYAATADYVDERRFDSLVAQVRQLGKAIDSLRAGRPSSRDRLRSMAPATAPAPTEDGALRSELRSELRSQRDISAVTLAGLQRDIDRIAGYNQTLLQLVVVFGLAAGGAALSSLILAIRAGRPPAPASRIINSD